MPVQIPTVPAATQRLAATTLPRSPEIRFALVGSLTGANVWALFDSKGTSYNDYAIRFEYWPRLYHLTIPEGQFQPLAANGMPSAVQAEGALFAATVSLRPDLQWTDGTRFTAEDVAFTVNTALAFELGFDWRSYYDPEWLDHAEALDAQTVKFFFKKAPSLAAWQYGALQGPIVQKAYWAPRIAEASALLPGADSLRQVDDIKQRITLIQEHVNELIASGRTATGEQARQLQIELEHQQGDLDEARNTLAKVSDAVDAAMDAARRSLYSVDAKDEPTLGSWMQHGYADGRWTNTANPALPFGPLHFDRAVYIFYPDEALAVTAFKRGDVNGILVPGGLSPALAQGNIAAGQLTTNASSSTHFLVINPARPLLGDPVLRRALFCAIDRLGLAAQLQAAPQFGWIPGNDASAGALLAAACGEGSDASKAVEPARPVAMLKAAGYSWTSEPASNQAGEGLSAPYGGALPPLVLLAPREQIDPQSAQAAKSIQQAAAYLGISISVEPVDPAEIRFALLNDHNYDLAIAAWRLSTYPGYLCDWFGADNPFGYSAFQITADCQVLDG
ncbi:MAG: ABC transporter substrate-binding protein, partial [Anaerolineae bacterium]